MATITKHAREAKPAGTLPVRVGPRPITTDINPHTQLNQQPLTPLSAALRERIEANADVQTGFSQRAPRGTVGFYAPDGQGPERAFMLGTEFAHIHPGPDHSLHLTLPEPLRTEAIAAGWAEAHPLAGLPTISQDIVMVYAPRDEVELDMVSQLVAASLNYARGS